jgi:hypothetical protein
VPSCAAHLLSLAGGRSVSQAVRRSAQVRPTNSGALTCGANPGSPVTPEYSSPFPFTGTLHSVTVDVSGDLIDDGESAMRMAMARQ